LACGQRKIHTSRSHISTNRVPRKAFPTSLKTLGDHIRLKRTEKGLSQWQLAQILHVPPRRLSEWEREVKTPSESEWLRLARALNLPERLVSQNPTAE
jgi:DNA-binding transcriptional regulator YiaG